MIYLDSPPALCYHEAKNTTFFENQRKQKGGNIMGYCYVGEWNGHQFVVEDGVIICRGEPDENGKSLVVVFERTTGLRRRCAMFADAEVVKMTVCRKEGEEFVPVPESDDDDTFNAAAWLLLFNMFNN